MGSGHIINKMLRLVGLKLSRTSRVPRDKCVPLLGSPVAEMIPRALKIFSNSFSISPKVHMSKGEITAKLKSFHWHYPFEFKPIGVVDATIDECKGLRGRHFQRYMHIFPALLSLTSGTLEGQSVLDIGCNCGFWAIQAVRAGAKKVVGIDASVKNIEQANFIKNLIGFDDHISYHVMDVYEIETSDLESFDIVLFLGLLYHLDKPIHALQQLSKVTRKIAIIDTHVIPESKPMLEILEDTSDEQNKLNGICFYPSVSAIYMMVRHVGFDQIYRLPNLSTNLPADYLGGWRVVFIAIKG